MYYLLSKIPPRFKLKVNAIEFNLQVYIIFSLQFFYGKIHSNDFESLITPPSIQLKTCRAPHGPNS